MRGAELVRLFRKESRMNSSIYDPRSPLARLPADFHPAKGIGGVDPDSDYVAGLNSVQVECFQGLVGDDWIAVNGWRRSRQHVKPARSDDTNSEIYIARIDQVNAQYPNSY